MIKIGIIGARGYAGGELIRILARHSGVKLSLFADLVDEPTPIWKFFPQLRDVCTLKCENPDMDKIIGETDCIFLGLPNKVSMQYAKPLRKAGKTVIDISADFRFKKAEDYEKAYSAKHTEPELLSEAVYGLPEVNREKIRTAKLIANPGCYPTSVILAAAPVITADYIDPASLIADSKTGISGAGRRLAESFHFIEANESVYAYRIGSHQHRPEIAEQLSEIAGKNIPVTFTPHVIPMDRGILSTLYLKMTKDAPLEEIYELYKSRYAHEPFVRLLPLGEFPKTKSVAYTNFCDIGIGKDAETGRLIIISAIDNLVKGASGQAVQNMNIIYNFEETEGLW